MEARLQKLGNSVGIRIPSNILKSLNLKTNDKIILEQEENKIIIKKQINSKISLKEKFKEYKGENLAKEFSWDNAKGKEIW
ncbi:MAG: AbrB/MazE/SpoVT family DNA-binding domain-containing protein [Bacilli bacterium]|nr:AbrB/MazE/SpoVT family DNA-binding domain-containing protein [Bacilli bacterium]